METSIMIKELVRYELATTNKVFLEDCVNKIISWVGVEQICKAYGCTIVNRAIAWDLIATELGLIEEEL